MQQSPSWLHPVPGSRQAQRPATQSIWPQHSALVRQPPRAPVQHRIVLRRNAHTSEPQHCASEAHTAVLPGPKQVVVGSRQRLPEQVKPGQQSVLDAQLSSSTRHAQ